MVVRGLVAYWNYNCHAQRGIVGNKDNTLCWTGVVFDWTANGFSITLDMCESCPKVNLVFFFCEMARNGIPQNFTFPPI